MDAFENIVAWLLENDGFWVRTSFKVNLTKPEKRRIGIPSTPRWEIDVVAYKPKTNEILAVECKSYLDSPGVRFAGVNGKNPEWGKRYKLFNNTLLRGVVLRRLRKQLEEAGMCRAGAVVRLCLAAGNIISEDDHRELKHHFEKNHWTLFDPRWILRGLCTAKGASYENNVSAVVAKLILRNPDLLLEQE